MPADALSITDKLAKLGDRVWPEEWSAREADTLKDYPGWCHRYRLEPRLSDSEVAGFERMHGVQLPKGYREFLTTIGNGGAGPGLGIFPLGEGEEEPLPEEMLGALATEFPHCEAWNDINLLGASENGGFAPHEDYYAYSVIAGSMEIATDGCGLYYLLVVSGPARGQIWYDRRTDSQGIEPLRNARGEILTFTAWYEDWLDEVWQKYGV